MAEYTSAECALLSYPGIARAAVAHQPDGTLVARVLPWGLPSSALEAGPLAELDLVAVDEAIFLHDEIFAAESYLQGGIILRQDAIVFDVGANIGMFSLFVAARCPSALIFAFEPVPDVFDRLRRNVGRREITARLFPFGLADHSGEYEFNFYPELSIMSCRSDYANFVNERELLKLYVEHGRESGPPGRHQHLAAVEELLTRDFQWMGRRCELRRTSDVIEEIGIPRIDLLKIDVQRAELDVLRGIDDRHWPDIAQVSMEVHDEAGHPTAGRLAVVTDLLRRQGFQVTATEPAMLAGTGRFAVQAVRPEYADDPRPVLASAGSGRPLQGDHVRLWLSTQLPPHLVPDKITVVSALA
jgi:FkbM family methyltransferase